MAVHADLKKIFQEYSDFVYRICLRYVTDTDEAQDMTQDIFLKINDYLSTFRTESKISTWIYRIAINHCIDYLRKNKRREELAEEYLHPLVERNIRGHEDASLAAIDLAKITDLLRPQVRKILFLSLAEGLSYLEVAKVLDLSKAAVAKTVERFLKKARDKGPRNYF